METVEDSRRFATFAILASIFLHLLLLWLVLQRVVEYTPPPRFIAVDVVRLKPPPPQPKPVALPKPVAVSPPPVPKPVTHAAVGPVLRAIPQHRAQVRSHVTRETSARTTRGPPVMHFGAAGAQAGLGLDLGTPAGGGGNGHGSIDAFDDAVKQRIQAAKTYPPSLPYMWNECVVSYSVTIDRNGALVDYKLWGCGNPFLDSASRAAILMASPYPLPPNFGGSEYTVFGSLVFKKR